MPYKLLSNFELPVVTEDFGNATTGFNKFYVINNKLFRKLSDGSSQALAFEDYYSDLNETNPVFTYTSGNLSRIDYSSGNYKLFSYDLSGNLLQVDFVKGTTTFRKSFTYDINSNLTNISFYTL